MAEQVHSVRLARAARKRVAAAGDDTWVTKKRVVLGELPNLSNTVWHKEPSEPRKPVNPRPKRKVKKGVNKFAVSGKLESARLDNGEDGDPGTDVGAEEDDPLMGGPYAADIHGYLQKMKVIA